MSHLLDLPTEVVRDIFEYVAVGWWPVASVKALCHTCRALCTIAQPILYRSFTMNFESYYMEKEVGRRFLAFTDTVARRPELRKELKTLELFLQVGKLSERGSWIPPEYDLGGWRAGAPQHSSSIDRRNMWVARRTLAVFPHVETLLSMSSHLAALKIQTDCFPELKNPYLGLRPESAQYLTNLKQLTLIGSSHDFTRFEPIMSLIVQLPRLRKLKLEGFDIAGIFRKQEARESAQWRVADGTLPIEDLSIRNCSMRNEILQEVINSCRRLTHFDYLAWQDIDYQERGQSWREPLDVEGLHAVLTQHKASLQELSITGANVFEAYRQSFYQRNAPLVVYPPFGSFRHLKTLKIEYRRMRYENLPRNLTYLYLYDCRSVSDDTEVEAWKVTKRNFCPDLETFEIMCTDSCRSIQYKLKYMHFHWGCRTEQTREWEKDGFLLKVWFQDFIDGTYHFSQVSHNNTPIS